MNLRRLDTSICLISAAWILLSTNMAGAQTISIVGYGDSLTGPAIDRWCAQVAPPNECDASYAQPGTTIAHRWQRIHDDAQYGWLPANATHASLAFGANDVRVGEIDWDLDFLKPLTTSVDALLAIDIEPVLVIPTNQYMAVPGESALPCVPHATINNTIATELRPRVEALAASYDPPLIVVDLNAAYASIPAGTLCTPSSTSNLFIDHVHQSSAGYLLMKALIVAEIEAAPIRPSSQPPWPVQTHPVPITIAPALLITGVWVASRLLRRPTP